MNINAKSEIFSLNISLTTHVQAETFRRYQSQGQKARQVYLNTLAVCAANSYLNMIGWSTNLLQGDSWSPISQTMMDVADLQVPGYGKLECRPVFAGEETVAIPPEVWSGRIGYLVVRLERDLKSASVIGFARQCDREELPIARLETLSKFPTYLSLQKRVELATNAELSSWMQGKLSYGWQKLEELFAPPVIINFRSKQEVAELPISFLSESRVKLLELEGEPKQTIALILNIKPLNEQEFDISVKVSNYQHEQCLPEGLELVIVDRQSHPVMIAQANQSKTIEFCFSGELRENFTVEIGLQSQIIIESFVI